MTKQELMEQLERILDEARGDMPHNQQNVERMLEELLEQLRNEETA